MHIFNNGKQIECFKFMVQTMLKWLQIQTRSSKRYIYSMTIYIIMNGYITIYI